MRPLGRKGPGIIGAGLCVSLGRAQLLPTDCGAAVMQPVCHTGEIEPGNIGYRPFLPTRLRSIGGLAAFGYFLQAADNAGLHIDFKETVSVAFARDRIQKFRIFAIGKLVFSNIKIIFDATPARSWIDRISLVADTDKIMLFERNLGKIDEAWGRWDKP